MGNMATMYLSPQQLKDFAQKVEEVAKKFPAKWFASGIRSAAIGMATRRSIFESC